VSDPADEAAEAMRLAATALPDLGVTAADVRVSHAENVLSGPGAAPGRWRIIYKRRELLRDDGMIGKGGEYFVDVDTAAGTARPGRGGD
jgi:hypothetical protein